MTRVSLLFLLLPPTVVAFVPLHSRPSASTALFSTEVTSNVPLIINGDNVELTPALEAHVERRIGNTLNKLGQGAVTECDVHLSVSKNPKVKNGHRCEVVTAVKGTTIICRNESPDMYGSIDMASHALQRKLSKYKQRRLSGWHGGEHMGDDLQRALDEMEELNAMEQVAEEENFVDPEKPQIIKVKSFDLETPISIDEAIFALDYIDHDFYVFRNADTNEINVVYKRHVGGVGHVEP